MNHITQGERFLIRKKNPSRLLEVINLAIWTLVLFLSIAVYIQYGFTTEVRAQTIPVYHTNAYYCDEWKHGERVVNADYQEVAKVCL
jgi:hypothetical protein